MHTDTETPSPSERNLLTIAAMIAISVICLGMSGYPQKTPGPAKHLPGSHAWVQQLPITSN